MAKYECIRGVVTSQGPVEVGQVVELSDYEAHLLAGKFIPAKDVPAPIRAAVPEPIENRDPVIDTPKRGRPRGR